MEEKIKTISRLIADEIEAINGYKESFKIFENNEEVLKKLKEIMEEEVVHKNELIKLLYKI